MTPRENSALDIELLPEKRGKELPPAAAPAIAAYVARDYRKEAVHFLTRGDPKHARELAEPGFLQVLMPTKKTDATRSGHSSARRAGAMVDRPRTRRRASRGTSHRQSSVASSFRARSRGDTERLRNPRRRAKSSRASRFLAVQLIRNGWRLKPVHRLILTSETWRQRSEADAERTAADLDNRLLSRQNLRRLEAEPLRDSLLMAGGLLDLTPFGEGSLKETMTAARFISRPSEPS